MAPLTNVERRMIANLSIPRNIQDLTNELLKDPDSGVNPENIAADLKALASAGFVVSLGDQHESPGHLASAADKHKLARSMPDEKAQLFETRLRVPQRSWRFRGEQWAMTADGFDRLHDPDGVGDPTPRSTGIVEARILAEFARVHKGDPEAFANPKHPQTLGDKLLEDEFAAWAKAVADEHERLTGERPLLPIAGGAGYSDATELLILDPENGKGSAYTETAPWFMAAVTVAITDADTGSTITEANYTGYARKSVAAADMNAASAGAATNANAITFAACTALTSAVIGFGKCAASTVGRLIKYGTCATVNVSSTQTPLQFGVGTLTTSLD